MRNWIVPLIVCAAYRMMAGSGIALGQAEEKLAVTKELIYTVPEGAEVSRTQLATTLAHWACCCQRDDKQYVVLDGKTQKEYDSVIMPTFSPDGKRFAYVAAMEDKGFFVVLDGVDQKLYEFAATPVFSPDGKRFAHSAYKGDVQFVVLDGVEQPQHDWIGQLIFSPDGTRFAYEAHRQAEQFVVLDGVEQPTYGLVMQGVFSPDGKRFAYCTGLKQDKLLVVLDGVEQDLYEWVQYPTFSPDGKVLAYAAESEHQWFIVLDGVKQKEYDEIGVRLLISPPRTVLSFSPDGKRFAYCAGLAGKRFVVLDGVEQKGYDFVSRPTFSPDGENFAYLAKPSGKPFIVLDGVERESLNSIRGPYPGRPGREAFVWYGWSGEVRSRHSRLTDADESWWQAGSKLYRFTARDKRAEPSPGPPTLPPRGDVGVLSQTDLAEARAAGEAVIAASLRGDVAGIRQGLSDRSLERQIGEDVFVVYVEGLRDALKRKLGDHWPPPLPVLKPMPKTTILNVAGFLGYFLQKEAKAEMRAGTWPQWHGGVAVFEYTFTGWPQILLMTKEGGKWKCLMGGVPSAPVKDEELEAAWRQLVQRFRDGELEHLSMLVWGSGE